PCGTAHNSTNDTPNIVNGGQGTVVNVEPCPSTGPICQESFCNPSKTDGIRTGLCDNRNLDNSATDPRCVDTNGPCTSPGCESGQCVQDHAPGVACPVCQTCNTTTGNCTNLDNSATDSRCVDTNGPCTSPGCESGQCV